MTLGGLSDVARRAKEHSCERLLLKLEIDVAQLAQCAVGAHFGCADGAFENGGDFGEGMSLESTQEQDFAITLIEFI